MIRPFPLNRFQLFDRWLEKVRHLETVSPWTSLAELCVLAEMSSRCEIIGEVGSYKGKSALAMAIGGAKHIMCCDRFQDGTYAAFRDNLHSLLTSGRVQLIDGESADGAAKVKQYIEDGVWGQFDAFFIDASHAKEDVVRDIALWRETVKPGGWLLFHDCHPGDPQNGIAPALEEVFPGQWAIIEDSIACVQLP